MTHISVILRTVIAALVDVAVADNPREVRAPESKEYDDEALGVECGMMGWP